MEIIMAIGGISKKWMKKEFLNEIEFRIEN